MGQPLELTYAKGEVRAYVDRLLEDQGHLLPFRDYLRELLQLSGFILSETAGSGLVAGALVTFSVVCPQRDWRDVIPGVAAGELLHNSLMLLDKVIDD